MGILAGTLSTNTPFSPIIGESVSQVTED